MEASASSARTPGTSSARARETRQATPPMARIAGVDIPRDKRLEILLTYIFGIGRTTSSTICDKLGLDRNTRVPTLTADEVNRHTGYEDPNLELEGNLHLVLNQDSHAK